MTSYLCTLYISINQICDVGLVLESLCPISWTWSARAALDFEPSDLRVFAPQARNPTMNTIRRICLGQWRVICGGFSARYQRVA